LTFKQSDLKTHKLTKTPVTLTLQTELLNLKWKIFKKIGAALMHHSGAAWHEQKSQPLLANNFEILSNTIEHLLV